MEVLIELSIYDRAAFVDSVKEAAARASSPQASERLRKAAQKLKESKR